jgi:membrane-bound lytic murein transglycosylase A
VLTRFHRGFFFYFLLFFLAGCVQRVPVVPPEPTPALQRVAPAEVPLFSDDMGFDGLSWAIDQSLVYLKKVSPDREFLFANDRYLTGYMIRSLATFREFLDTRPSAQEVTDFLRQRYLVYQCTGNGGDRQVLFTGYYEPVLHGSLTQSDRYRFPVYTMPDDLIRIDLSRFHPRFSGERIVGRVENGQVLPYHDREAISFEGRLQGKADVIAWVDDRIDLFFLHIQGSGKIFLENGDVLNVHYQSSNGRPYRSIGRLLIDEGKIDKSQMSMQKIREYLEQHPTEMRRILSYNPSYVFFRSEKGGPVGALGVPLTPGRSLATDRRLFPDAALTFVETEKPLIDGSGTITEWSPLNRFMMNQDTGGAISGPDRADVYWGADAYAALAAGHLQHPGRLYFFVLAPENP